MHPVLAKYLSFEAARQTLEKLRAGVPLDADEQHFAAAAQAEPERWKRVEAEPHLRRPAAASQQAQLALAADAALRALEQDPALREPLLRAQATLTEAGSPPDPARAYLAALVAEEAFAWDDEALGFDTEFFSESLAGLAPLAALTPELLATFERGFVEKAVDRRAAEAALEAFLRPAWAEGPELLTPDHLRAALHELQTPTQRAALAALLEALERAGLLAARRCGRLLSLLRGLAPLRSNGA